MHSGTYVNDTTVTDGSASFVMELGNQTSYLERGLGFRRRRRLAETTEGRETSIPGTFQTVNACTHAFFRGVFDGGTRCWRQSEASCMGLNVPRNELARPVLRSLNAVRMATAAGTCIVDSVMRQPRVRGTHVTHVASDAILPQSAQDAGAYTMYPKDLSGTRATVNRNLQPSDSPPRATHGKLHLIWSCSDGRSDPCAQTVGIHVDDRLGQYPPCVAFYPLESNWRRNFFFSVCLR